MREPITDADRDGPMAGGDLTADEHEIVLSEEVVDVTKRVVAKARVRLETETETDQVAVDDTLRKERIELDHDHRPSPSRSVILTDAHLRSPSATPKTVGSYRSPTRSDISTPPDLPATSRQATYHRKPANDDINSPLGHCRDPRDRWHPHPHPRRRPARHRAHRHRTSRRTRRRLHLHLTRGRMPTALPQRRRCLSDNSRSRATLKRTDQFIGSGSRAARPGSIVSQPL